MIVLETERLTLRGYAEADLADYHALMSDRKNMYFLEDIVTDTLEESRESLTNAIRVNESGRARRFCIALREHGRLIGGVGYEIASETPAGKIAGPMGWFIKPEFQNKGYITEAAGRVIEFAFVEDGCVRITTGCFKENIPTQRVMAKVGFRKEAEKPEAVWHDGRMRDRLEFAINRNEYIRG